MSIGVYLPFEPVSGLAVLRYYQQLRLCLQKHHLRYQGGQLRSCVAKRALGSALTLGLYSCWRFDDGNVLRGLLWV